VAGRQRAPRRPAQRPDQILDAAERLLAEGAAELNMDLVAEAAGLSKGTLYHYYAAKTEILDALRKRYLERTVRQALTAADRGPAGDRAAGDGADRGPAGDGGGRAANASIRRLDGFIRALLDDANANGALVWALFHDTGTAGNAYLSIVSDALHGLIQQGVAAGDLAIDDADTVASFFAHGCFGRIQDAFHGPGIRPADLATELTTLLERLVTPIRAE
jgi:AcrR family transcriptional regulator